MIAAEKILSLFRAGNDSAAIASLFRMREADVVKIIEADQDRRYAKRQAKRGAA